MDPLPTYKGEVESLENSEIRKNYPLLFTDEHSDYLSHHSWMRGLSWLRRHKRYPYVKINPDTAKKYGIEDGDWIEIESPNGKIKAVAKIFEGIRKDVVMGQHGWWEGCEELNIPEYPCLEDGVNVNMLYNWKNREKLTGDITKNTMVRIKKSFPPKEI